MLEKRRGIEGIFSQHARARGDFLQSARETHSLQFTCYEECEWIENFSGIYREKLRRTQNHVRKLAPFNF